ncbi:MAG: GNAT family N-acetyltransferase [Alphaproteobacteria bacterium]|nr:GNAT family N-acetyltransferase [Alphaproteobacteria bacterium]
MTIEFKTAPPDLAAEYIRLRSMTRENGVSEERLRALGITATTWANDILSKELQGFVAQSNGELAGYCFGNTKTGEFVVLAVKPVFEGQGIGRHLLSLVVDQLKLRGHKRLFLGCSSDPSVRSYGFYRHLGWLSTGAAEQRGDEVLELLLQ